MRRNPGRTDDRIRSAMVKLLAALCACGVLLEAHAMTRTQFEALSVAREQLAQGSAAHAVIAVRRLLPQLLDDPVATGIAWQVLGHAETAADNLAGATDAFERALATGSLPRALAHDVTYNLAQTLINRRQYLRGLTFLEHWLRGETSPPRAAHELAATAYLARRQCGPALPHLDALQSGSSDQSGVWAQARTACAAQLGHSAAGAGVELELLPRQLGDKRHWQRAIAARRHRARMHEAVALMELAELHRLLTAQEILELARLYLAQRTPYEAARLLDAEMKRGVLPRQRSALELLANAWWEAHEYANAETAFREIVSRAPDGNAYLALGRIAFERENWTAAVSSLQAALAQPVLQEVATAQLLLGISAVHLGRRRLAERALAAATKDEATQAAATWWLAQARSAGIHHGQTRAASES